ncbi:MAG TPA: DMT family transporter [Jatrophihabitans sp.]|jgi:drug/metabolite transporter (DMT)-like permease|nr:DMT family transporter [Jatrophihabitans sp.]
MRFGLGLAVLSAATFGTSGSFAASLMAVGWTPGAAVSIRIGVAALVLSVPAVMQLRGRWSALRASLPTVLVYGMFAVAGAQLCFFNAVDHVSVGVALLLEYSGTLLVVAWVWLRHGQRPRRLTTAGAAVALAGLVLVLDLTGSQRVDVVGVLWGLGAATGLAVYFVISSHDESPLPPIALAWSGLTVGAVLLLLAGLVGAVPMHASTADADFAGHRTSWLLPVAGMSIVAAVIAYCAGIGAARRLGARLASFVGLSEVLFAVLVAWALLAQRPTVLQAVGGVVVLAGIALVKADEREQPVVVVGPEPGLEPSPAPA